jgi:general secretion pathway protein H
MPTSRAGNWTSGFTLIELAVVTLLLALLAGLTVPLLNRGGDGALRGTARRLTGTIRYLYNEAALSGHRHRLLLDMDRRRLSARRLEADGNWEALRGLARDWTWPEQVRLVALTLPGKGTFSTGEVSIGLYPSGGMDAAIIQLSDDRQRSLTLRLLPLTGSVEIHDGLRDFATSGTP